MSFPAQYTFSEKYRERKLRCGPLGLNTVRCTKATFPTPKKYD